LLDSLLQEMFWRNCLKRSRVSSVDLFRSKDITLQLTPKICIIETKLHQSRLVVPRVADLLEDNGSNHSKVHNYQEKAKRKKTLISKSDSENDENATDVFSDKKLLSESISPSMEEEIVENKLGQKFILKQVLVEIHELETRKNSLPLPEQMDVNKWKQLLSLTDKRARFHFLDSLLMGTMSFEEIQELDNKMSNTIHVPEDLIFEAVGDDSERRRRINLNLMHHELMRQEGQEVPYEFRVKDLKAIAEIQSVGKFKKYLEFMNITHRKKIIKLMKQRKSNYIGESLKEQRKENIDNCDHIYYGLGNNCIHMRLSEKTVRTQLNWNSIREFQFGSPLVIDFSYLSQIKSKKHIKTLIHNEATLAVNLNREARTPFALYFTGVSPEVREIMDQAFHINGDLSNVAVEITEKSQLDLFPKEKLVYLSPDSRNYLNKYNDDDIYVIGGIIDRGEDRAPMTLSSAKRNKIRHAAFPMRKTIGLKADLNVETCVGIMTDLKASQDWFYAMRWVPPRFFANRLKINPHIHEFALSYRAHRSLSPTSHSAEEMERNRRLTAPQYKRMYKRLIEVDSREEMNELLDTLKI